MYEQSKKQEDSNTPRTSLWPQLVFGAIAIGVTISWPLEKLDDKLDDLLARTSPLEIQVENVLGGKEILNNFMISEDNESTSLSMESPLITIFLHNILKATNYFLQVSKYHQRNSCRNQQFPD